MSKKLTITGGGKSGNGDEPSRSSLIRFCKGNERLFERHNAHVQGAGLPLEEDLD